MTKMMKITIPKPVDIFDNGKVVLSISFHDFLERVFTNPVWMESWKSGRAQLAITQSFDQAVERGEGFFVLTEEDWKVLDGAVKTPLSARQDGGVLKGFGYLPQYTRYVVPLSNAIIDAERL
jgi:hypothetical protein